MSLQVFSRKADVLDVVPLTESKIEISAPPEALRRKALQALGGLPPFSAILNRLMASLAGEDVSFTKLGDLIEKDTVVAGNLLHLVNSALYGRRGTINSVRHALAILGLYKIRNAVLSMSLTRMWSKTPVPNSWSMARFNMHSAAVALLSDLLAQRMQVDYPEGAFVGGLLHDLGRLLIAIGLKEKHERILQVRQETGAGELDAEMEVLGFTHPELSADALTVWNIPEQIRVAVRYHHNSSLDSAAAGVPLSRVLEAANNYVNSLGVSINTTTSADADPSLIETLGFDERRLAITLAEFKTEFDAMAQFFH